MPDGEVGHVLTAKVGPLPLVLWVAGGASVIFIVMMARNKGNSGASGVATNQVSALAPTEAEAFGALEQQQQDVTNALTTLGNNQSALGGSMSTLTGIVTQQGSDNAASFQNLVDGQNTIEQGQQAASSQATNYYQSLLTNLTNYYNSLLGGVNNLSGQSASEYNTLSAGQTSLSNQIASGDASLAGQIGSGFSNLTNLTSQQFAQLMGVQTNPWIKAWYENQVLSGLTPGQQQQYWAAMAAQSNGQAIGGQATGG